MQMGQYKVTGILLLAWATVVGVQAGPVEEAQALLAKKQYAAVDTALAPLLVLTDPPAAALEVSFKANRAAGRWVTASQRMNALLRVTGSADPEWVWQGAELAAKMLNEGKRREHYRRYVALVEKKDARTEQAYRHLLARGSYPDVFKRYLKVYGADDEAWGYGLKLWDRLRSAREDDSVRSLAAVMGKAFSGAKRENSIGWRIYRDAEAGLWGSDRDKHAKALQVLLRNCYIHDANLAHHFRQRTADSALWVAMLEKAQVPLETDFHNNLVRIRDIEDDDERVKLAARCWARLPLYRDAKDPAAYARFLGTVINARQAFRLEGREVVPAHELVAKYGELVTKKVDDATLRTLWQQMYDNYLMGDLRAQATLSFAKYAHPDRVRNHDAPAIVKASGNRLDFRVRTLDLFKEPGHKAVLTGTVKDAVSCWPGTYDADRFGAAVFASKILTVDEKLAILKDAYQRSGYVGPFERLLAQAQRVLKGDAKLAAWVKGLDKKRLSPDPFYQVHREMYAKPKDIHAVMAKAFKVYGAPYPQGKDKIRDAIMSDILSRYWSVCYNNRELITKAGPLVLAHVKPESSWWDTYFRRVAEHGAWDAYPAMRKSYLAHVDKGWKGTPYVWYRIAGTPPTEDGTVPLQPYFKYLSVGHTRAQMNTWDKLPADKRIAAMAELIKAKGGLEGFGDDNVRWMLDVLWHFVHHNHAKLPDDKYLEPYWQYVFAPDQNRTALHQHLLRFYPSVGKRAEAIQRFAATGKTPGEKIRRFSLACAWIGTGLTWNDEAKPDDRSPKHFLGLWKTVVDAEAAKLKDDDFPRITIDVWPLEAIRHARKREADKAEAERMTAQIADWVRQGARLSIGNQQHQTAVLHQPILDAVADSNWPDAYTLAAEAVRTPTDHTAYFDHARRDFLGPMAKELHRQQAWELLFFIFDRQLASPNLTAGQRTWLQTIRAQAAQKISGLYPVPQSDDAYDLFVAADEFSQGKEVRAWELTEPKLALILDQWPKLDKDYVAWVVEQLRRQRQLDQARKFALTFLMRTDLLSREQAAALLLSKADIYRDQQNYEAAKIEYEGLRRDERYTETDAGERALSRIVELMIATGNYDGAEAILERWRDHSRLAKRAQAHYFTGRIAFERKEYEEARQSLQKVFDIFPDHTEGRLLEGELKALTGKGVGEPEIPIGRKGEREYIVPGRQLALTITDRNLAVAKAGQSIPVVVTTSEGKDEERINLFPGATNPHQFRATISTGLGKATPGNLLLEIMGADTVRYEIAPEFVKANQLGARAGRELFVVDDARLAVSAGRILTEREEAEAALRRQAERVGGARSEYGRTGKTVRPGNPVYVMVRDRDRDVSNEADTVTVRLHTKSGDVIEAAPLTETEPHSGVFRAAVATGVSPVRADASDAAPGFDPGVLVNATKTGEWNSVADSKAGKWIEVDTNSSHEAKSATIALPKPELVSQLTLMARLAGEYQMMGSYPPAESAGGVTHRMWPGSEANLDKMRTLLKLESQTFGPFPEPSFQRAQVGVKNDTWLNTHTSGYFHLAEDAEHHFTFLHERAPHNWQFAYLVIDGKHIIGGQIQDKQAGKHTGNARLKAGIHKFELFVRDHWGSSNVIIGVRGGDGEYAPLPAAWFSPEASPELEEFLSSKATIERTDTGFTATFVEPHRVRALRWVFDAYEGQSVAATKLGLIDADDNVIIPADVDFTSARGNDSLEISPGDEIYVTYQDEARTQSSPPELHAELNATYINGKIRAAYESLTVGYRGKMVSTLHDALRFRIGDQLIIEVDEADLDVSENADTVALDVVATSGARISLEALEVRRANTASERVHSGLFRANLKLGDTTDGDTIKVEPGDVLTIGYLDRENTDPGVPYGRTAVVREAGEGTPDIAIYATRVERVEDESIRASTLRKQLAARGEDVTDLKIYRDQAVAALAPVSDEAVRVSMNVPLVFQVTAPFAALHEASILEAQVYTASEKAAAEAEGRELKALTVPMTLTALQRAAGALGYSIQTVSSSQTGQTLENGLFQGVVRLQVGSPGDPIDDLVRFGNEGSGIRSQASNSNLHLRIPTLLVPGADTVYIRVKAPESETWQTATVKLAANGRIGLLDETYTIAREGIQMGERFYLQIVDPDRNRTAEPDAITVDVKSGKTGNTVTLTLTETLPRSGIFTGYLEPFVSKPAGTAGGPPAPKTSHPLEPGADPAAEPVPDDPHRIAAAFGDELTFTYVDDETLSGAPITVTASGKIHLGADGELVGFTKQFQDPEMAVKVRFLRAEALFEMAKQHYKLKNMEKCHTLIAEGRDILEEALRDYPNTSLISQGRYLLANLAQELARVEDDQETASKLYNEAIGRYANIISAWPDTDYAPRSQFKMAVSLEKLGDFDRATEEFVKLTYTWPEHQLVPDATVRLANHYYKVGRYDTAAKVFANFYRNNEAHPLAPKTLFLSAQCYIKQAQVPEGQTPDTQKVAKTHQRAIESFKELVDNFPDEKDLRSEAMYWLGDTYFKTGDMKNAYITFKKLTWDYPETRWAKLARGYLTDEKFARIEVD